MCYSHNQYNSLTPCVCPEQGYMLGETMAVNGEKVRIKALRICACAAAIIISTNHLQ